MHVGVVTRLTQADRQQEIEKKLPTVASAGCRAQIPLRLDSDVCSSSREYSQSGKVRPLGWLTRVSLSAEQRRRSGSGVDADMHIVLQLQLTMCTPPNGFPLAPFSLQWSPSLKPIILHSALLGNLTGHFTVLSSWKYRSRIFAEVVCIMCSATSHVTVKPIW